MSINISKCYRGRAPDECWMIRDSRRARASAGSDDRMLFNHHCSLASLDLRDACGSTLRKLSEFHFDNLVQRTYSPRSLRASINSFCESWD